MKILVTGAKGFVGKNLIAELRNQGYENIYEYGRTDNELLLDAYTKDCDFVFHLAGVNRPINDDEFMEGNKGFTTILIDYLKKHNNYAPIVLSSSIQARENNLYGQSKKAGENEVFSYAEETGANVYVYRLPNLFGKWSRPHYNSVIATFCHNIARGETIQVNDPNVDLELAYIDDVVNEFISTLNGQATKEDTYCVVKPTHRVKLGEIAELIQSFKESRTNLSIPNLNDPFTKKLYSTYLSYLSEDDFAYELKMNVDDRGSFTEFLKTKDRGQVSVNISKPGITKGNHWHHTKNEKFLVVSGEGVIRFRKLDSDDIIEYKVSGDKLEVVDIPVGYTHSIVNIGEKDLVTVMWVNEIFNPNNPDTYYLEV